MLQPILYSELTTTRSNSSVIVHALERTRRRSPLAYIYCHFQEQGLQNPRNILGSIAKQLAFHDGSPRSDAVRDTLAKFYAKWKRQVPPVAALVRLVRRICEQLGRPYLVIDGIDEAERDTRKAIAALLKELRPISTAFLVSGRSYIFDTSELSAIGATRLAVQPRQEEVVTFVRSQLRQNDNLSVLMTGNRQLESAIVEKISSRAAGQSVYTLPVALCPCQRTDLSSQICIGPHVHPEYRR